MNRRTTTVSRRQNKRNSTSFSSSFSVSQTLAVTFGKGTDSLEFLINYFLSKIIANLQMWASESDVIKETGST